MPTCKIMLLQILCSGPHFGFPGGSLCGGGAVIGLEPLLGIEILSWLSPRHLRPLFFPPLMIPALLNLVAGSHLSDYFFDVSISSCTPARQGIPVLRGAVKNFASRRWSGCTLIVSLSHKKTPNCKEMSLCATHSAL